MSGGITVAGSTSAPWTSEDTHFAILHDAQDRLVVIEECRPGDELAPESAVRALARTTGTKEEEGIAF